MANTWAVAGCSPFTYGVGSDSKTKMYCEWSAALEYLGIFKTKGWRLVHRWTVPSVCAYVLRVEELIRGDAIAMARVLADDEKLPWGDCLIRAAKTEDYWKQEEDVLMPYGSPMGGRQSNHPKGGKGGWSSNQGKGGKGGWPSSPGGGGKGYKSGGSKSAFESHGGKPTQPPATPIPGHTPGFRKFKTSDTDHMNRPICKDFNTNVGCKAPCKKGHRHCCNVVLVNSKICESTSHARSSHDPKKFGAVQRFK